MPDPQNSLSPTASTWLDLPADHPFGIAHLPYGVFSTTDRSPRVGVRIGDWVLDVSEVARIGRDAVGVGDGPDLTAAWEQPSLNPFLDLGHEAWGSRPRVAGRGPHRRRPRGAASGPTWCRSTR